MITFNSSATQAQGRAICQITMALSTHPTFLISLILIVFIFCSSSNLTTASDSKAGDEFNYAEGTEKGPESWGHINPKWKVCGDGNSQSPIDIPKKGVQMFPQLGKLTIDYKPARAFIKNRGHDIMLRWNGDAGKFNINGTEYKLLQCHWHAPSEHTLNGSKFDMELHVVHQSSKGERAVIGVWYKIGKPDRFLSELLPHIKSLGDKDIDVGTIDPRNIKFRLGKYYRYAGSLTTPPCDEGVIWTVLKKVRTVSIEQLITLKAAVPGVNARPTQKLHGRQVWLYADKASRKSLQDMRGSKLL